MASFNPFQVLEGGDQSASLSEDLTACFAKIHKKDLTSKLKGFQDLFAWIKTADDISVLSHEFVHIYNDYGINPDRQLRLYCQELLYKSFMKDKTFLKLLLPKVVTTWIGSTFDPYKPVADVSSKLLTIIAGDEKALKFKVVVADHVSRNLQQASSMDFNDLGIKLSALGEKEEDILYSQSLFIHYTIKAFDYCCNEIPDTDFSFFGIFLEHLKYQAFTRKSVLDFLFKHFEALCVDAKLVGKYLLVEKNQDCLVSALPLIVKMSSDQAARSDVSDAMKRFLRVYISLASKEMNDSIMKLVPFLNDENELLRSLKANLDKRIFVEQPNLEAFLDLYLTVANATFDQEAVDGLFDMIVEETVPLGLSNIDTLLPLIETHCDSTPLLQKLLGKLQTLGKPSKMLLKLPVEKLWNLPNFDTTINQIAESNPSMIEVAKIMPFTKSNSCAEIFTARLKRADVPPKEFALMVQTLTWEFPWNTIMCSRFATLSAHFKAAVLDFLPESFWGPLVEAELAGLVAELAIEDAHMTLQLILSQPSLSEAEIRGAICKILTCSPLGESEINLLGSVLLKHPKLLDLLSEFKLAKNHSWKTNFADKLNNSFDDRIIDVIAELFFDFPAVLDYTILKSSIHNPLAMALLREFSERPSCGLETLAPASSFVLSCSELDGLLLASFLGRLFTFLASLGIKEYLERSLSQKEEQLKVNLIESLKSWLKEWYQPQWPVHLQNWTLGNLNGADVFSKALQAIPPSVQTLLCVIQLTGLNAGEEFTVNITSHQKPNPCDADFPSLALTIVSSNELTASKLLFDYFSDLDETGLTKLIDMACHPMIAKRLSIRSDSLALILRTLPEKSPQALTYSGVACSFGKIDLQFWEFHGTSMIQSALDRFRTRKNLMSLRDALRIVSQYLEKHSSAFEEYYRQLFEIWKDIPSSCLLSVKSGLSDECQALLSKVVRNYISHNIQALSRADAFVFMALFSETASVQVMLAIKFFATITMDTIQETCKTTLQDANLFPWSDFTDCMTKEQQTIKRLVLLDIFLAYAEGALDAGEIRSLYTNQFSLLSEDILELIIVLLGWDLAKPTIDLSKHEFMNFDVEDHASTLEGDALRLYAAHLFTRIVKVYPTSMRSYYTGLAPERRIFFEKYFTQFISPILTARELERLRRYNKENSISIKVLQTSTNCSVQAKCTLEDLSIELNLQVPTSFPLKSVDVSGGQRFGISEAKWRSWILSCQTLFRSDTINILDGLLLWRKNVEKSLEGMEPCPICYCIFHAADKSLPGPTCKTCSNRYHPSCLYKWFKSSGNATCPMCRGVF